jgi:hypothetical protein
LVATPGPKRAERCPVGPFFEHLWDFSDNFVTGFYEVRSFLRLRGPLCLGEASAWR